MYICFKKKQCSRGPLVGYRHCGRCPLRAVCKCTVIRRQCHAAGPDDLVYARPLSRSSNASLPRVIDTVALALVVEAASLRLVLDLDIHALLDETAGRGPRHALLRVDARGQGDGRGGALDEMLAHVVGFGAGGGLVDVDGRALAGRGAHEAGDAHVLEQRTQRGNRGGNDGEARLDNGPEITEAPGVWSR